MFSMVEYPHRLVCNYQHAIIKVFESQVPAEGDQFITEGLF